MKGSPYISIQTGALRKLENLHLILFDYKCVTRTLTLEKKPQNNLKQNYSIITLLMAHAVCHILINQICIDFHNWESHGYM